MLPTRLPDKAKPRKPHGKASARSYTGAEAAELAANQAEQRGRLAADQTARPHTPETICEDFIVPNTPPAGEFLGRYNYRISYTDTERLQGPPELIPGLASEPQGMPDAQVEPPASTAPARIEQGSRKRRRVPNKLVNDCYNPSGYLPL